MKPILLIIGTAVVTLLIATQVLAQETAEVPSIAELKKFIEEGLLQAYGRHYEYRRETDGVVIGLDSIVDWNSFKFFPKTDYVQGGRDAADVLAETIMAKYGKAEGDVALINSIPGVDSLDQLAIGFKKQITAKYPGLILVADKVGDGQAATASNIMTDLIRANPKMRGVFAPNLIAAYGVSQVIAEKNLVDKIKLISFDPDKTKLIKFGVPEVVDTTVPNSYAMKRQKKGDTASGVVIVRKNTIISIDITPCSQVKEIVTFVMPYKEKQISDADCGKDKTYQRSQVIQQ